jgi:hypothetical protein
MRRFQLLRIDSLFRLTLAGFGLIITTALLAGLAQPQTVGYYITTVLHHVSFSIVLLVLTLIAVLWTGQLFEAEHVEINEEQR